MDAARIAVELKWLADHSEFEERPATIREFVGADYLNIEARMRAAIMAELEVIMGDTISAERMTAYRLAMLTGGIGIGKTTIASVVLTYLAHWVLCLKDPQDFFDLLPGSRIAFMQMSTSGPQAKEVVFGDIKARIEHSPWFQDRYPYDRNFKNQIRFSKDIWILPGDSAETTFEGYNILGGILDEADSHKVTEHKDYAEQGYTTISSRVSSRFGDRGFLMVIGQMKKGNGFAAKKYEEFRKDPDAYAVRMAIWESFGWDKYLNDDGTHDSFWYDSKRREIVTKEVAELVGGDHLIEVPNLYLKDFQNNPEKALRDLAGIPPAVGSPFISLGYKITEARDKWIERYGDIGPANEHNELAKWFHAREKIKRVAHIDLAYSASGDGCGVAMGHVPEMVEIDGELRPFIVLDLILRIKNPGRPLHIADVRRIIYDLKDHHGFNLKRVSMDGFQCFTGDTPVPLLDGRTLTLAEMADQYPDGGVWVYSWDGIGVVPGLVTRSWRTATRRVLSVTLDNGEVVRCTPDHRWMLRDGTYRPAADLCAGDSLMPLYRRVTPDDWKGLRGYEQVWQPRDGAAGGRKWQFTHRMACPVDVPQGHIIHHVDFNKRNNDPTNLRVMSMEDHLQLHQASGASFGDLWKDPGFRHRTSSAVSRSNRERTGQHARRFRPDITVGSLMGMRHMTRRQVTDATGWSQDVIYARVREAGFSGWADFRRGHAPVNHRVVSVVDHDEIEEVFDLSVDGHHNFALGAGVIVHNSTDTLQQLERRRFETELVSVDRQVLPYYDLREAIYDGRIAFPPYQIRWRPDDTTLTEILVKELTELVDNGDKIDHPPDGSKDVADAVAGVCFSLMGNRAYHRKVISLDQARDQRDERAAAGGGLYDHPAFAGMNGARAPIPPSMGGDLGQWRPPTRRK